ncbi:MAG: AarF/ABC1/UbiB kinase family protein [Rubricoccaceae bacterium]|nr:AarF/ABC1/UbiB kinase family protein [Rubricoccaceae bacterium]
MLLRATELLPVPAAPPAPAPIPIARPASRRFRLARAYGAAARVALSYLLFDLLASVRGQAWARRKRDALHRRNGRRVRRAILRLRGLFIKAGQLASVLTNFLPEPFRVELEGLQDQVPAGPYGHVRARIRAELGDDPEALFAAFDPAPIASASLAQVHRATLADGRAVAVKVQHADIEAIARLDLRAIGTILRVVGRWFGVRGLREQLAEIEAIIVAELDFEREAENLEAIAASLAGMPGVAVPAVVYERSSRRVLTTAFIEGVKANDLVALERLGLDPRALGERIMRTYGRLIFRAGLYHADPHPGNLIVQPDGTLVFLDFGAVARLSPAMQRGLAEFLMGTLRRDAGRVTASLAAMGFVPVDGAASGAVVELIDGIHARVLRDLDVEGFRLADVNVAFAMQAHAETFDDMAALGVSFRDLAGAFKVPSDWILLERTTLLLLGLCTTLAPDLNPFRVLWPYVEPLAREAAPSIWTLVADGVQEVARTVLGPLGLPPPEAPAPVVVATPPAPDPSAAVFAVGRQIVWTLGTLGTGTLATVGWLGGSALLAGLWGTVSGACALALAASMRRGERGATERRAGE